jgi:hypothetical protein
VKHCPYGHCAATLLNPCGAATVSQKYRLIFAKYATVVMAIPSTIHYHVNNKLKIYYLR